MGRRKVNIKLEIIKKTQKAPILLLITGEEHTIKNGKLDSQANQILNLLIAKII